MMRCTRSWKDEGASDLLAQQDADTPQVDETEVVERMTLIAHDQPAEVAQPCEEMFDFPAAFVAAQRPAVLGLGPCPDAPMRRDHFDARLRGRLVERVGVSPINEMTCKHWLRAERRSPQRSACTVIEAPILKERR